MAAALDGPSLVDVDVGCRRRHHALMGAQQRVDDHGIGLCAADEEEHIGFGAFAGLAYLFLGLLAPCVEAIGEVGVVVGLYQSAQHVGVRTVVVVAFKG